MSLDLHPREYKKLLESTQVIPWRMEWPSMTFSYVGPQIEQLLGWSVDTWHCIYDWADMIHPEERDGVIEACMNYAHQSDEYELDYRAQSKEGSYRWIRDVIRVVHNDRGAISALIGFKFDITERKRQELALAQANQQLQLLSMKDATTGMANRLMFEEILSREWMRAQRHNQAISLILIELDEFEAMANQSEPATLQQLLCQSSVLVMQYARRGCDLAAHLGEGVFALMLPGAAIDAASQLAIALQEDLIRAQIPLPSVKREGFDSATHLTASIGLANHTPQSGESPLKLLDLADRALVKAKQNGRNSYSAA
uniref:sensor domain-containing diguanylate cyclase n=1 Tax=Thaumasiovibrio occultus TaxID=1891184 RepID=UPI000B362E6F|nr:diguanylate cyclase [Thaumasiovibrio occultus]